MQGLQVELGSWYSSVIVCRTEYWLCCFDSYLQENAMLCRTPASRSSTISLSTPSYAALDLHPRSSSIHSNTEAACWSLADWWSFFWFNIGHHRLPNQLKWQSRPGVALLICFRIWFVCCSLIALEYYQIASRIARVVPQTVPEGHVRPIQHTTVLESIWYPTGLPTPFKWEPHRQCCGELTWRQMRRFDRSMRDDMDHGSGESAKRLRVQKRTFKGQTDSHLLTTTRLGKTAHSKNCSPESRLRDRVY